MSSFFFSSSHSLKSALEEPEALEPEALKPEPLEPEPLEPKSGFEDPIIIGPTPHFEEPAIEDNYDCMRPTQNPRWQEPIMARMAQPYMGVHNDRLWDKRGMMGRFMGPIEDFYFHFIPNEEMMKVLTVDPNRVVT